MLPVTRSQQSFDHPIHAAEVHVSCGVLFDLVILAGGTATRWSPLCNEVAKPMMLIGNRPLVWYCVQPWIERGTRTLFICAHDFAIDPMRLFLEREFPMVKFHFVVVPLDKSDEEDEGANGTTTTCDAVRCYHDFKKALRTEGGPDGLARDAMFVACETILAKIDVEPFVANFYTSFAAAAVLLWRPCEKERVAALLSSQDGVAAPAKAASTKKKGADPLAELSPFAYENICVAYEDTDRNVSCGSSYDTQSEDPVVEHHRLHYFSPEPPETIPTGFAARRPNLTFCLDTVDSHVYLVRSWVVEYIATGAGGYIKEFPTSELEDILPLLTHRQHSIINAAEKAFLTPYQRIQLDKLSQAAASSIWLLDAKSTRSVGSLNSMRSSQHSATVAADPIRVVCTVYNEKPSTAVHCQSIRRIVTKENLLSLHHHVALSLAKENYDNAICRLVLQSIAEEHDAVMAVTQGAVHVTHSLVRTTPHPTAFITRSFIGQRVRLGQKVRITNSVILDDVEVGDNVEIVNSIIGSKAEIHEGVKLVKCFVGPQLVVSVDHSEATLEADDE